MKLKQLLSVVLMLCMIASSCVALAAPDYDANYTASDISFGYVDGGVWTDATSLVGGGTVSAKISASTSGNAENMVFSLFVYKNGKMYDCEIVTKEVGSEAVDFMASANVPADSEGCQAVAVLWNNFYDMKMICDSALFPGTNTKLRGLYVDGELVTGFDPDVTEYVYAIEADAERYPEITWEKADASAKVTYTKPASFPGRSVVTVEGAAGEKTDYVVKYECAVGDFISNIGGLASNPVYVKGGFKVGAEAYNDRPQYTITAIDDPNYEGADMIQASIAWQSNATFQSTASDWITFDAARGVTVKVLKSDTGATQHFINEGFTLETTDLETGFVQTTTNAIKNHKIAMSKHFNAGKVSIPAGGAGTTYLVAIMLDPIGYEEEDPVVPGEPVDESLMLSSLSVDGVEIAGFAPGKEEYTHILTAAQLANENAPEVTCTLADDTSTAEIKTPSSFPGYALVTVTNASGETAKYVINYSAQNIVTNLASTESAQKQAVYVPGGIRLGGYVASDRMTEGAWNIAELIPVLKDNDAILAPVDGWLDVVNTFSFDLGRKATIRVVQNSKNLLSAYTDIGFTAESDTNSVKLKITNAGGDYREYAFMASKECEPGKVTLPYTKPNMPTLTALEFIPWANASSTNDSLNLTEIKVDGASLEEFDPEEFEYVYNLSASQMSATDAPEVTYTLADDTSSAVVETTKEFPGKATITITNTDFETRTYTITYKAGALVANITPDAAVTKTATYVPGGIKLGGRVASDRATSPSWAINMLIPELDGQDAIITPVDGWLDVVNTFSFDLGRNAIVTVIQNNNNMLASYEGFTANADTTSNKLIIGNNDGAGQDGLDIRAYQFMASKEFDAGNITLPYTKPNMPTLFALKVAPWGGFEEGGDDSDDPVDPSVPVSDPLALSEIRIDGTALADFDADTTEYDYTLSHAQVTNLDAPSVVYTLADDTSSVVVVNPTEFPGSATITVTDAQNNTRTYTINYKATGILSGFAVADSAARAPDFVAGGFVVGANPYYNRPAYAIQEINDESLVGKDYIIGNIEWQNNATFNSATYTPWITLNSKRDVTVTILKTVSNGSAEMIANGFTYKTSDNDGGFAKADTNSEKNFKYAFTKDFEAGEVIIPNGMSKNAYFVVFSYAPWEDAEDFGDGFSAQSITTGALEGDILVSGTFRAKNVADDEYYVVLETYDDNNVLIETQTSEKLTMAEGKNTFSVPFDVIAEKQNTKAYAITESNEVICEPVEKTIKSLKHLFIGNSFSVNAHTWLYEIAKSAGYNNIALGTLYIGGCSLKKHYDNSVSGDPAYSYYKNTVGAWEVLDAKSLLYGLQDEKWMTISLQQASADSGKADTYEPYLTNLIDYVNTNKTNPDAKLVWHMTWAYSQDSTNSAFASYDNDQMTMYNAIVSANQSKILTNNNFTAIIPSGTAIQNARTSLVGDTLNSDGQHLENEYGCYVAGLMTFKTLTGEDINGITFAGTNSDEYVTIAKESVNNAYAEPFAVTQSAYPGETEPEPPVVTGMVKSILVDGVAISGFDADTLQYTKTLTATQMAASTYPEVTWELNDTEAVVEVSNPVSFPGFAEVKVTNGSDEKIYKINYELPVFEVALSSEAPANTPGVSIATGMAVGDMNFKDRPSTFPIEAINDETITDNILWIKTCIGWQTDQKDYCTVFIGAPIEDWLSFEANRGMVVTVYEDNTNNTNKFNYWTTETSSTPYIQATAGSPLKYTTKHRRYFEAGEMVNIPNAVGNRVYTVTVQYLGWGEEAPELDVTIPEVRQISYSDLVMKVTNGANANVTAGTWAGISDVTTTKYQLSKEFADITEPTEITLTTDKIAKGYGIIVVAPLDSNAADKNVIVNADGTDLEWAPYNGVVVDYSYTNDGDEDFDAANATFVNRNSTAVTSNGGTAYVYDKMSNCDEMYITGSALATDRNPYTGQLHWTALPEEYLGCNYIVLPFSGFNGGERTFTFTVNQPVKIYVHSSASNMTASDNISADTWTAAEVAVRRRMQNVMDHLTCAYLIKKGYINKNNIVFDGTNAGTNGVQLNRYDVYEKLKEDCGSYLGWAIDPEKVEATGFTESINDYRYEEYLEAWVD